MNLREGTRRLALLLGVAGAILGGFASYMELQTVKSQRTFHDRFEQLANSDVVRREREQMNIRLRQLTNPVVTDSSGWESGVYPISGGIKNIRWGKNLGVDSIETADGQTLYPTQAPAAWEYLFIALSPILGFLVPWGAVRAIGWVGAGFFQPSK